MPPAATHRIELSEEASKALREIGAYIAWQGAPLAAENMVARLLVAIEGLAYFPMRGRPVGGRFRELTNISPYVIRYSVKGTTLRIVRIRHAARRPT